MAEKNMNAKISVEFEETANRQQLSSGDNLPTLFGKIKKVISDLSTSAFSGSYNDLSDTPDVVTKEYVDPVKSLAALNRTTLGTQCKNLLKNNAVTKTVNGVTFTVNSDGSVTVKQTTTAPGNATIDVATNITLNPGTYILTGDDEIKKSGYGEIRFYINGTIYAANTAHTFDEEVTISAVRIFVWKGVNINGSKTIYPMLRYADITDDTYEPYKESVDERLIQNKSDIAVNKSTLGYQRKNILDETGYLSSIISVTRGTKSISENQITLTATADNCFTNPHTSSDGGYRIPVEPDTDYILSWESDNTYAGLVYVFMNGNTSNYKNANNKVSKYIKFTTNSDTTFITIRLAVATSGNSITYSNIMLRYADILDDTYEPYQPSVQEQINNFGTQQQLLCDYSSAATSSVTIQIAGLFSNYSAVICTVKYYLGTTSITLPLKYIKSIGKSKEYSPVLDLGFRYVDNNNLLIGGADAAISNVKIISLY